MLDAFARALPLTYTEVDSEDATLIALTITGDSGGRWFLLRENGEWNLYVDADQAAVADLVIDQDAAWRLFTKGISKDEALARATLIGDESLATKALDMVSVIA